MASDKQQAQIEELCGLITLRQMQLADALRDAQTSADLKAIAKSIGEYSWNSFSGIVADYETFCEKTRNKAYPSIAESDKVYSTIKTSLLTALGRTEEASCCA